MGIIEKAKRTFNKAIGRHESGLSKEFAQDIESFIAKYEDRVRMWRSAHPGRPLPIGLNPKTKELVWLNRKARRSKSN